MKIMYDSGAKVGDEWMAVIKLWLELSGTFKQALDHYLFKTISHLSFLALDLCLLKTLKENTHYQLLSVISSHVPAKTLWS